MNKRLFTALILLFCLTGLIYWEATAKKETVPESDEPRPLNPCMDDGEGCGYTVGWNGQILTTWRRHGGPGYDGFTTM